MSVERIENGLQSLNEILGRPALDPDPAREDFRAHQETLEGLVVLVDDEILGPLDAALAEITAEPGFDSAKLEQVKNVVADRVADAGALLLAAQRSREGRRLLQAAIEIAPPGEVRELLTAGLADPVRFGRLIRTWWLASHERMDEARVLANQTVEGAAGPLALSLRKLIDAPRPIDSAPSLFGVNGCGLRVYGSRDESSDGTYVTTRYVTALFVPVLPIDAFRVATGEDGGWYFLGKVELGVVTRWWRRLVPLALVLAIAVGLTLSYYNSVGYQLGQAIEVAQAAEAGAAPEDRAAVVEQYERILVQFPDASRDDLRPPLEGFVRVSAADVPSPLTLEQIGDVERLAARYLALPVLARDPSVAGPMVEHLEAWAAELGTDSTEAILGGLTILGYAEQLSGPTRIRDQRYALSRRLAEALAQEWPLEAIRQYVSMPEDRASIVAAGSLIAQLGDGPSVWIELGPTLERWTGAAQGIDELSEQRTTVRERRHAAREYVADPERLALLEDPQIEALKTAIEAAPGDQELAVALADQQLTSGDAEGALVTLSAIGVPGRLVLDAQAALAATYVDLGRDADADALLERVLTSRLPAFESARRAYREQADALHQRLLTRAQAGTLPRDVQRRLGAANEAELPQLFAEYVDEQISGDVKLSALRDEYSSLAGVVGIAIQWGTLKLRRANAAEGEERQALLDGAERAFLAIGHEGSGMPSYHLGLGQVYYRLGKETEGEAQMQLLLTDHPPEVHLAAASAYRELGLLAKAREVAQRVYDTSASPLKEGAASMMAVMATERDDTRMWLKRSNADSPSVKLRLLELDGAEELEKGHYDLADEKFAQVAKGWLEQTGDDGSGYNNAALALMSRYECTADIARLRDAVQTLEKAHGLAPDNALVVGNLGGALESLATAELLSPHVQLGQLRLGGSDARAVLVSMIDGPHRGALQDAMNKNRSLKRALEYLEQGRVLAPRRPSSYASLLQWYALREDAKGLARINRTLEDTDLDLGDARVANTAYIQGTDDKASLERIEQRLSHYDEVGQGIEKRGSAATKAALAWLRGEQLLERAILTRDLEAARQASDAFSTAEAMWDGLETTSHARALVEIAMLEAMDGSPSMATAYGERRRSHGGEGFLISLLVENGEAVDALRARPEIAKAVALRGSTEATRLRPYDWVLGQLGSAPQLSAQAVASLDGPRGLATYEAARHLHPQPASIHASLYYLRGAAAPTAVHTDEDR